MLSCQQVTESRTPVGEHKAALNAETRAYADDGLAYAGVITVNERTYGLASCSPLAGLYRRFASTIQE